MNDTAAALVCERLTKTYRLRDHTIEVLRGIELSVARGEWVALQGSSGCGKTTLLHLLGALDRADTGDVRYFGASVPKLRRSRQANLRRRHIGFVFQSYQLFAELDALENVMLPGWLNGLGPGRCRRRASELLTRVNLGHRLRHRPTELSGGEQQRIAIARALMNQPDIILADEPTGNLDRQNADEIMGILSQLRRDDGKTIILATHDRELTRYADRTYRLDGGSLTEV